MAAAQPRSVVLSYSLYRLVLRAYPAEFRRSYGAAMAQVFCDSCRDAHRRQGATGVVATSIAALADLIASVLLEWAFRRSPLPRRFLAWCGFASIASGVVWALGALNLEGRIPSYTHAIWHLNLAVASLLSLMGLVGLYTRYGPSSGRAGQFGLLLADLGAFLSLLGNALEGLAEWEIGYLLFMLGMMALLSGLLTFGVANWSRRELPRWSVIPHLISALGLLLAAFVSIVAQIVGLRIFAEASPLGTLLVGSLAALFGLGWIALGCCLWWQHDTALPPSAA